MTNQKGFAERLDIWLMIFADLFVIMCLILMGWLSLVIFNPAEASVFADVGKSKYNLPDSGIYWQDGHASWQDMESTYLRLGVQWEAGPVTLRGSVFSLGKYMLESEATPFDDQYNCHSQNYCNGPCPAMNRYVTSGGVKGLSLTFGTNWKALTFEAGPTLYQQKLSIHVFHPNGEPIDGYNADELSNYALGYTAGIGAEFGQFRFGAMVYAFDSNYNDERLAEKDLPGGVTTAYVGYVGYRF